MAIEHKGFKISNVAISSATGHFGRGLFPYTFFPSHRRMMRVARVTKTTSLTKSSTYEEELGDFRQRSPLTWWRSVKRIPDSATSLWNHYALTNEGIMANAIEVKFSIDLGYQVIINYYPQFHKGLDVATRETLISGYICKHVLRDSFRAWEISYSCPNSNDDIEQNVGKSAHCTREIKKTFPDVFLIVKGSIVHPLEFWEEQVLAGADAAHSLNAVPIDLVYSPRNRPHPLKNKSVGAISGGKIKKMAFAHNKRLGKALSIPKLFGGGVENLDDVRYYREVCGADVVVLCSAFIRTPKEAEKIIIAENR